VQGAEGRGKKKKEKKEELHVTTFLKKKKKLRPEKVNQLQNVIKHV